MSTVQYCQIRLEDAIALYREGNLTACGLLKLYIKIKFPTGKGIELETKQVCEELGISRSQFYKSIAKLKKSEGLKAERTHCIVMEGEVK